MNRRSFIGKALGLIATVPLLANTKEVSKEEKNRISDFYSPKVLQKFKKSTINIQPKKIKEALRWREQEELAEQISLNMSNRIDEEIVKAIMKG